MNDYLDYSFATYIQCLENWSTKRHFISVLLPVSNDLQQGLNIFSMSTQTDG